MPSGSSLKARRLECQLNGQLQVDICTKESCILLQDFDQGFTITPWAKGCFFEPGTSLVRNKLLQNKDAFGCESEVIWFHESESKYAPVPGRRYAPAKSSGGLNWCPSIHPSTTEKISISLRPGLGLRSPIVERKKSYYCRGLCLKNSLNSTVSRAII